MHKTASSLSPDFSLTEARNIVKDLFRPNAAIYWADFLFSWAGGVVFFTLARGSSLAGPPTGGAIDGWNVLCFFISCLFIYRSAMFTHEMVHLPDDSFRMFRIAWNLLCGIPYLVPSFTYYPHVDHHRRKHYGTDDDGEYLRLGRHRRMYILLYLLSSFVIPPLVFLRFLVLTPLTWISPPVRRFVHRHASTLVVDPMYIRPLPGNRALLIIRLQEGLCFLWCAAVLSIAPIMSGIFPVAFLLQAYLTGVVVVLLNSIRTLASHRWTNTGGPMSFVDQLLDSTCFPRWPLFGEMWAPVGLRFHSLHHLFPSLPYHNLPAAHRRLMNRLPADSPYRRTICASLSGVLVQAWRNQIACRY